MRLANTSTLERRVPRARCPSPRHNLPDSDTGRARSPRSPMLQLQTREEPDATAVNGGFKQRPHMRSKLRC